MNSIGEIIATNRKKKKLTQPQLAEKLAEHGIHGPADLLKLPWDKKVLPMSKAEQESLQADIRIHPDRHQLNLRLSVLFPTF